MFIALIIFVLPFNGFCSHVVGGYIQYTWLKNNRYGIELKIFRDCRGIALGLSGYPIKITFVHKNGSTIATDTIIPIKKSIQEVTFGCAYLKPQCLPQNSTNGGYFGLEKHIYYAEIDFDSARFKSNFQNSHKTTDQTRAI